MSRKEDVRFLTGRGRYIDDIVPEGALHAHFFLSPVAHAKIVSLDLSEAKEADGVHAVYCAQDLIEAGLKNNMRYGIVRMRDGRRTPRPPRPVLAENVVRFAGEPVAVVIADTAVQAKDAAELIEFDYEDLPVHLGLGTGGYAMHEEAPENVAFDWAAGEGDAIDAAFADAAHVVSMQLDDNRVIANSMEPRGCYAEWSDNRLHLAINGQSVWVILDELVYNLGLDRSAVRVTTPDVGGGFGMKGCIYPENLAVAQAARMLGRTVHWMGTRSDAMLNDNGGRDLTSVAEAAFDEDFRILAYRVGTVANMGAYISPYAQFIQTELFQKVVTGVYDIPHTLQEVVGVFTNTAPVDAYRGAGRPEGIYVIERFMDRAARELGIDSLELRRRNFIKPNQFPYRNFANETVDVGDFDKVLSRAEEEADLAGFDRRRRESEAEGRLRGLGVCYYIETILGDPNETTRIEFAEDGFANMYVGTQSNGQGHETAYAQILHERSGIPFERIRCIQGDSDLIRTGGGTGGSRSVTTQGTSIRGTADKVIAKLSPFVADLLDASDHQVVFEEGTFRVANSNKYMDIMEAASAALAAGRNDLVSTEVETEIDDKSFPNGAHICEVEVDAETGRVSVAKYTVVDDLGLLINPVLAEGQVHGGVVQGIGQVVTEHVAFDDDGQLLTGTFMDYAMPRADNCPFIEFHSEPTFSVNNPLGMKGCGEAGTIGALASVANAVLDALASKGVENVQIPLTPNRVWDLLREAA